MALEAPTGAFPWRLTPATVHLCIDVQRLFSSDGPWPTPWLARVLPSIVAIAQRFPERTIFTRFIPPPTPDDAGGTWRNYYRRWRETTLDHLDPRALDLVSPLDQMCPPATVLDKPVYSAFGGTRLRSILLERRADALVVTGSETDVCVLATVLDAVDLGFPVFVVTDAICSSTDASHDAVLTLYQQRFSQQIQTITTEKLLSLWC